MAEQQATYAIDFETYYDKALDVKSWGPIAYAVHPDAHAYLVSIVGSDGFEWVGDPKEAPWERIAGAEWVSHNRTFDLAQFHALDLPAELYPSRWHCTADLAGFLAIKRDLLTTAEILLGVEVDKSARAKAKGKVWPRDFNEEEQAEMLKYALDDSRLCLRVWLEHGHKWPEFERRLSEHTTTMVHRGIPVNLTKIEEGIATLERELFEVEKKIPWAGEPDAKGKIPAVTSTLKLKEECARQGIPAPKSTAKDSADFAAWLEEFGERAPFAKAFGEWKSVNRTLQELRKMRNYTVGGRLRYDLKYFGGHTGRWSGGGKEK